MTFALKAAGHADVHVITKKHRAESNTNYARGGIAAGLGPDDDPSLHMADTLEAGAGLCRPDRVRIVVEEGPARVEELVDWGARFQRNPKGNFSLGREGGHSRRRIVRAGDRTGREIERTLLQAIEMHRQIRVSQDFLAVDLLTDGSDRCVGVRVLDTATGELEELTASVTFLATGGCGQLWSNTTNPAIATGDGIAMAWRAGARVANLEFVQFHPTALYPVEDPAFLLSEALRGEGAVLRRIDGTAFMDEHHERGSLAPRDVVAMAIHRELAGSAERHVVLDVSAVDPDTLELRFPGAMEGCRIRGIDPVADGIPVVPAAHYLCGGVVTDEDGRTSVSGLLAAGEVACTGVHGANRLASNSLLEALVFSHRAAGVLPVELDAARGAGPPVAVEGAAAPREGIGHSEQLVEVVRRGEARETVNRLISLRNTVRALMWREVGILRSRSGLDLAVDELEALNLEIEELRAAHPVSLRQVELGNLALTALLVARCAGARRESRGLHRVSNYPDLADDLTDTVLDPRTSPKVHHPPLPTDSTTSKGSAPT